MRDEFSAPTSPMARFFRYFVIAVAGAQTAFWLRLGVNHVVVVSRDFLVQSIWRVGEKVAVLVHGAGSALQGSLLIGGGALLVAAGMALFLLTWFRSR